MYSYFFGDFESRDSYKKNSYKKETVELKRFIKYYINLSNQAGGKCNPKI